MIWCLCCGLSAAAQAQSQPAAEPDRTPVEATTASGDKVLLYPTGRWEFVDAKKAEVARKAAAQYPENNVRPAEAQGGLFGVGRTLMPGDKDYNRGSLSPKTR
ncbi:hypothetical protein Q9Q94_02285 [Uliginosibacterium sp. 31-16]|uniref:hypothetical protein n=1 Tax=Uliginosibacterium sp. 31-16 TaxID=3068315 RepID=UPI00273E4B72|nr:hypothetical protein [Uliginosibacterium sp. 31-16]MDP5238335.1 hypothetical protein [Uliginosibacterium sp. 31-16]